MNTPAMADPMPKGSDMTTSLPLMIEANDDRQDSTVIEIASLDDLSAIHDPMRSLALCPRSMPSALAPWLDDVPKESLPNERLLIGVEDASAAFAALFESASLPEDGPARVLREDMVDLIERFATLAGLSEVDVRVQCIRHDACKKFHRDHVRLRLICCYQGPTTEWVPAAHGQDALDHQKAYAGPLRHFPRFAVAVFKGHDEGVVHRSPPIVGTGKTRFMLCLNEPSIVSPERWQPT